MMAVFKGCAAVAVGVVVTILLCTGGGPGTSTKYREKRVFEADYVTLYYADVDGGSKCELIDQMSSTVS